MIDAIEGTHGYSEPRLSSALAQVTSRRFFDGLIDESASPWAAVSLAAALFVSFFHAGEIRRLISFRDRWCEADFSTSIPLRNLWRRRAPSRGRHDAQPRRFGSRLPSASEHALQMLARSGSIFGRIARDLFQPNGCVAPFVHPNLSALIFHWLQEIRVLPRFFLN